MADISLIEKTNENAILFRSTKKATEFLKVACSEMQGEGMDLRSQTTQKQDISCLILDWQPADATFPITSEMAPGPIWQEIAGSCV